MINREPETRDMHRIWAENGYTHVREVFPRYWCGIHRFIYTTGVCCGLDSSGYLHRFCFDTMQNAELFLRDWDGRGQPVIGEDGCTAIK